MRISEKKQQLLHKINLYKATDFLEYYPMRYETIEATNPKNWNVNDKICLQAKIVRSAVVQRFQKRSITKFYVYFEGFEWLIQLYNRPWTTQFQIDKDITIFGVFKGNYTIVANSYNFVPLQQQIGLQAVYSLVEGLHQKDIRNYVKQAWEEVSISEFIPSAYRQKYRLISKTDAIYGIHWPKNKEMLFQSLRYLKYEEFLKFQLVIQSLKLKNQQGCQRLGKVFSFEQVLELQKVLTFQLTNGQLQVIHEILKDMQADVPMVRMLQGDVGCGKTVVAAFAIFASYLADRQSALMVPTEILAKQHASNLQTMFQTFNISVAVLYSSMKSNEKKEIIKRLQKHEIDVIIGTHALFQEQVNFSNLGLVIADEQHRFGVQQRRKMIEKGDKVDLLLMSATPIPRTLAKSLFGDMEVSTILELPKNRKEVETTFISSSSVIPILKSLLAKIDEGNQCYIVCSAIEKKEDRNVKSAEEVYEGLQAAIGKVYKIGLLHGKMNAQEKDMIMQQFKNGNIQILISTTVIEVGVDVPNANIMVIYDAHRFGLSQLHQLRGRVGRGSKKGQCFLLSSTKDPMSLKRLKVLVDTKNGFDIAQADLELRGPGDLLGTRQSGIPSFVIGNLIKDCKILEIAKEDAISILTEIDSFPSIQEYLQTNKILID